MDPVELRRLAETLRQDAARENEERAIKVAHIIRASAGLAMLKRKLGVG